MGWWIEDSHRVSASTASVWRSIAAGELTGLRSTPGALADATIMEHAARACRRQDRSEVSCARWLAAALLARYRESNGRDGLVVVSRSPRGAADSLAGGSAADEEAELERTMANVAIGIPGGAGSLEELGELVAAGVSCCVDHLVSAAQVGLLRAVASPDRGDVRRSTVVCVLRIDQLEPELRRRLGRLDEDEDLASGAGVAEAILCWQWGATASRRASSRDGVNHVVTVLADGRRGWTLRGAVSDELVTAARCTLRRLEAVGLDLADAAASVTARLAAAERDAAELAAALTSAGAGAARPVVH
jgi:hypothetical protein